MKLLFVVPFSFALFAGSCHSAYALPHLEPTKVIQPHIVANEDPFIKHAQDKTVTVPAAKPVVRKVNVSRSAARPSQVIVAANSSYAAKAVAYAMAQVGRSYVAGGTGSNGFDCSGLTMMAYKYAGISIGRTTWDQWDRGVSVSKSQLQPGDLVFYYSGKSHVAIYIGNGKIVHAGNYSTGVSITSVDLMPFAGARRII